MGRLAPAIDHEALELVAEKPKPPKPCAHLIKTPLEIFMKPSTTPPLKANPDDEDMVEQAHPGHGIPSQYPERGAQFPLNPKEAEREAKSVLVGGGVVAGVATGAAIGAVVAGPVGIVVGATVGTVVGALGAAAADSVVTPEDSNNALASAGRTKSNVRADKAIALSEMESRGHQ